MNLPLSTALVLAASQTPPDSPTVSPLPGDRVSPGAEAIVEAFLSGLEPAERALMEATDFTRPPHRKPAPRFLQTTTTSRSERRARGDYRTVRQIIADFEAKKE